MVFSTHRNKLEEAGRDGRDGHGTDRLRKKWGVGWVKERMKGEGV
jgi:hypothetical protein